MYKLFNPFLMKSGVFWLINTVLVYVIGDQKLKCFGDLYCAR